MIESLQKFRDIHLGKRIWICGSGHSLLMVDENRIPEDDILIACNSSTYHFVKMDYCFFTDGMANFSNWYLDLKNKDCDIILSNQSIIKLKDNTTYLDKHYGVWKLNKDAEKVIGGHDVIQCATHVAYVMGASEIILCGVDLKYKSPTEKYPYSQELIDDTPQHIKESFNSILGIGINQKSEGCFDGYLGLSLDGWKYIVQHNEILPIKTISTDTNLTYFPQVNVEILYKN